MRAGYIYAREIDIKDFYASFDRNKLVEGSGSEEGDRERTVIRTPEYST